MAAGDYYLNLMWFDNVTDPTSVSAGNSTTPITTPGRLAFMNDSFGLRVFQYIRCFSTVGAGALISRWGGVAGDTAVTGITSGTVLTAVKSAAWTASTQDGAIFYVDDDAGAAGAAPEGEISLVATTATGSLTLDSSLPLTTAIAVNDAVRTISNWQAQASADGDLAQTVLGVAPIGITSGNYGWVQMQGFCKAVCLASITVNTPVVADAGVVGPFGSDGQELHVGTARGTVAADNAALTVPVTLTCFSAASVATAP